MDGKVIVHKFPNSLCVPGASRDLLSTTELEASRCTVVFAKDNSHILFPNGDKVKLEDQGRLRVLPLVRDEPSAASAVRDEPSAASATTEFERLWAKAVPLPPNDDEKPAHHLAPVDDQPVTPASRVSQATHTQADPAPVVQAKATKVPTPEHVKKFKSIFERAAPRPITTAQVHIAATAVQEGTSNKDSGTIWEALDRRIATKCNEPTTQELKAAAPGDPRLTFIMSGGGPAAAPLDYPKGCTTNFTKDSEEFARWSKKNLASLAANKGRHTGAPTYKPGMKIPPPPPAPKLIPACPEKMRAATLHEQKIEAEARMAEAVQHAAKRQKAKDTCPWSEHSIPSFLRSYGPPAHWSNYRGADSARFAAAQAAKHVAASAAQHAAKHAAVANKAIVNEHASVTGKRDNEQRK